MSFLEKLQKSQNPYKTLSLINQENHDELLINLNKLMGIWNNYDIRVLLIKFFESKLFTNEELKKIFFAAIKSIEGENLSSQALMLEFGSNFNYTKDDLRNLFYKISLERIKKTLVTTEVKAIEINRKLYDAVFQNNQDLERQLQSEMLKLFSRVVGDWNLQISEDDLIELISVKCKQDKIEELFINMPLKEVEKELPEQIGSIVDENFSDDIEFLGCGSYSMVFKQGNKVIKASFFAEEYISYDHDFLLSFNKSLKYQLANGMPFLTVGVQNLAINNWYEEYTPEEINIKMYEVFCKARNKGYIIADIKKANFGIFDGQLVVIDSGFIYKENEFDFNDIDKLVPLTSREMFMYFMKLYEDGYRLNGDNKLEQGEKRV